MTIQKKILQFSFSLSLLCYAWKGYGGHSASDFAKKINDASRTLILSFPNALDEARQKKIELAKELEEEKGYDQAQKIWEEMVQSDPHNAYYLYRLGRVYSWIGKYSQSERALTQSLTINPQDADAALSLAYLYLWTNRVEKAKQLFTQILGNHPSYSDARTGLSSVKKMEEESHKKIKAEVQEGQKNTILSFREGIKERETWLSKEADRLEQERGYGEAEKIWEYLLRQEPDNPYYLYKLGRIYAWKGEYAKAEKLLTHALQLNPKDADAQLSLAYLYFWTQRDEKSKDLFQKILKNYPDYEEAKRGLQKVEESLNEKKNKRA